jgi:streptogramin lyase
MRAKTFFLKTIIMATILHFYPALAHAGKAPSEGSAVLTGRVSSMEEGAMEGVLVSAKKNGSTITVTVVSDEHGRYSFPAGRLEAGRYNLRIRATGYDLDGPEAVDIPSGKTAIADLKLRKTADLASQLTNAEWLMSFPGTEEQKKSVLRCAHCHTLERVVRSHHDAEEFEQVIERMLRHTPESFPLLVQQDGPGRIGRPPAYQDAKQRETLRKQAEYLSTLNLSSSTQWSYALKTYPRPKGDATRVIVTEYDLPEKTRQPHDVVVDSQGTVWYASFGEPILGKLDPKTGKTTEYQIPVTKPDAIKGNLDLALDADQNPWMAMTFQAAVAKFDKKTEKFQVFRLPPDLDAAYRELTFLSPEHSNVDGKVWVNDSGSYTQFRLDIASGKFETLNPDPASHPDVYAVTSDASNNAYLFVIGSGRIGRIDAKTREYTFYSTPTPDSGPRRGMVDAQGRLWFGENRANRIGVFDTHMEKFQEWVAPKSGYLPYDVAVDKHGKAWTISEFTDSVLRLDPVSSQFTEYLLPRETNMRKAFVDNSTALVNFWVGNTHGASIVKLEPLD